MGQIVVQHPEGFRAVIVVGVDDREGTVDTVSGGQHGMGSAPGLDPAVRDIQALRQVFQALEGIAHRHAPADPIAYRPAEVGLHLPGDDENDGLKPGAPGVKNGIVDQTLSAAAHAVHLLQAAVPAAHSGGQDDQNRFLHRYLPPSVCILSPAFGPGVSQKKDTIRTGESKR